jgi:hypothetical protein
MEESMSHSLVVFTHVTSAMAIFGALGMEGASPLQLCRAASAAQVQVSLNGFRAIQRVGPLSLSATVVSGVYLAATVWGPAAWINVAFASLILTAVIGAATTRPRIARLQRLASDGDLDVSHSGVRPRLYDPFLWMSFTTRTAILIGIVFLMTTKPGLEASLITMGTAVVAGLVAALPLRRPPQVLA